MDGDQSPAKEFDFGPPSQRRHQLQSEMVTKYTEEIQPHIQSISQTLEQGDSVDPEVIKELRAQFAAFDEFLSLELYAIGDLDAADLDTIEYPPVEDQL